jgi:hypothetical protein
MMIFEVFVFWVYDIHNKMKAPKINEFTQP